MTAERLDRSKDFDYLDLLNSNGTRRGKDFQIVFGLNSIFTELSYTFNQKVLLLNKDQLVIPALSGGLPRLSSVFNSGMRSCADSLDLCIAPSRLSSTQGINTDIWLAIPTDKNLIKYSTALINTTRALYTLLEDNMTAECTVANHKHSDFLVDETFFANNSINTMKAGVQSIMQSLAILTHDIPKVYSEDRVALTRDIIEGQLLDEMAMSVPFGWLARSINMNQYIIDPIGEVKPADFSNKLRQSLISMRHENLAARNAGMGRRKKGCPAAYKNTPIKSPDSQPLIVQKSGIQLIAELFPPYLDYFYNQTQK